MKTFLLGFVAAISVCSYASASVNYFVSLSEQDESFHAGKRLLNKTSVERYYKQLEEDANSFEKSNPEAKNCSSSAEGYALRIKFFEDNKACKAALEKAQEGASEPSSCAKLAFDGDPQKPIKMSTDYIQNTKITTSLNDLLFEKNKSEIQSNSTLFALISSIECENSNKNQYRLMLIKKNKELKVLDTVEFIRK